MISGIRKPIACTFPRILSSVFIAASIYLTLLLSAYSQVPTPQKDNDNRIQFLIKEAQLFIKNDTERAIRLFNSALSESRTSGDKSAQAICNFHLGKLWEMQGKLNIALDYLNKALVLCEENNDLNGAFYSLESIGGINSILGNDKAALDSLFKAKKIKPDSINIDDVFDLYVQISAICLKLDENILAIQNLKELIEIVDKVQRQDYANKANEYLSQAKKIIKQDIFGLINMGTPLINDKNTDKALPYIKDALNLATAVDDIEGRIVGVFELARISELQGNTEEAIRYYEESLRIARIASDRAGIRINLGNLGLLYFKKPNFVKAREYIAEYYSINKGEDSEADFQTLSLFGLIEVYLGNLTSAHQLLDESLQIALRINKVSLIKDGYVCMAILYERLHDYDKASEYLTQSIKLASKDNDTVSIIDNLRYQGRLFFLRGNNKEALLSYEKGLSLAISLDDERQTSLFQIYIGEAYHEMMNDEKALIYFLPSLKWAEKGNDIFMQEGLLVSISQAYVGIKDWTNGIHYAERALDLSINTGNQENIARAHLVLGRSYFGRDEIDDAIKHLEASAEADEQTIRRIQDTELRIQTYMRRDRVYEYLIACFYKKIIEGDKNYKRESFQLFEKGLARGLLDLLSDRKNGISVNLNRYNQDYEEALFAKIEVIKKSIRISRAAIELNRLSDELVSAKIALEEYKNKIRRTEPRYASIKYPQLCTVEDVQKNILKSKDEALLEFSIGKEHSFLFVIRKDRYQLIKIDITTWDLYSKILQIRSSFDRIRSGEIISINTDSFDVTTAHALFLKLLYPAERYLGGIRKLIIVPSGVLNYLPLEMLIYKIEGNNKDTSPQLGRVRFIIEKYSISYSQSASVLNSAINESAEEITYEGDLLAIANPSFKKAGGVNEAGLPQDLIIPFEYRDRLRELPYSETEVKEIGKEFYNPFILAGDQARKDNFLKHAQFYPIIHVASHGLLDEYDPLYSGIVFAYNENIGTVELLTTREIFGLKLDCELVTLSACETALGQKIEALGGEGVSGLARAFIYAGARSIIVSQWAVEDESTALLMSEFYKGLMKKGLSKSSALREAKLHLMKLEKRVGKLTISYRHPFFWAPFVLIGNPG